MGMIRGLAVLTYISLLITRHFKIRRCIHINNKVHVIAAGVGTIRQTLISGV
jgi:hypothetical protein